MILVVINSLFRFQFGKKKVKFFYVTLEKQFFRELKQETAASKLEDHRSPLTGSTGPKPENQIQARPKPPNPHPKKSRFSSQLTCKKRQFECEDKDEEKPSAPRDDLWPPRDHFTPTLPSPSCSSAATRGIRCRNALIGPAKSCRREETGCQKLPSSSLEILPPETAENPGLDKIMETHHQKEDFNLLDPPADPCSTKLNVFFHHKMPKKPVNSAASEIAAALLPQSLNYYWKYSMSL